MKKGEIFSAILKSIGAAGLLGTALVFPNALRILDLTNIKGRRRSNKKYYINQTIERLKKEGLIQLCKRGDKKFFQLTKKGKAELLKSDPKSFKIKKGRWDGKWRIVIFDIKESNRGARNQLRGWLQEVGFVKLQNSVWVFPYKCDELVFLIKTYYELGKNVLYLESGYLENDTHLKKIFKLT